MNSSLANKPEGPSARTATASVPDECAPDKCAPGQVCSAVGEAETQQGDDTPGPDLRSPMEVMLPMSFSDVKTPVTSGSYFALL